MLRVGFEPTR